MTNTKFSDLDLAGPIQRALADRNHVNPTLIQARAIPEILAGRDLMGIAQTGTGKTAAFALPILNRLSRGRHGNSGRRLPRALVLAPTRELAIQISEEIRAYAHYLRLYQTIIFGGVSQKAQVSALQRGVDIVTATPGRLLDLMDQGRIELGAIEVFVLDEADRMLDMGFVRDVQKIIAALPINRQSLMFSATMPTEIIGLSGDILTDPTHIEVTPRGTPVALVEQCVYHVTAQGKRALLASVLEDPALSRVLVFSRTKRRANRIAQQLDRAGIDADVIHSNVSQNNRQRVLKRFRAGEVRVLVATDIAARGIDVADISHVINYELPSDAESYVHRIGRTARAGAGGVAFSFCDPTERKYLNAIERLIRSQLIVVSDGPVTEQTKHLTQLKSNGYQTVRKGRARNRRRGRPSASKSGASGFAQSLSNVA